MRGLERDDMTAAVVGLHELVNQRTRGTTCANCDQRRAGSAPCHRASCRSAGLLQTPTERQMASMSESSATAGWIGKAISLWTARDGVCVGGICECDPQLGAKEPHGHRRAATAHRSAASGCKAGPIDSDRGEVDVGDRPLLSEHAREFGLEHPALADQDSSDNIAAAAALNESLRELFIGDESLPDEQLPKPRRRRSTRIRRLGPGLGCPCRLEAPRSCRRSQLERASRFARAHVSKYISGLSSSSSSPSGKSTSIVKPSLLVTEAPRPQEVVPKPRVVDWSRSALSASRYRLGRKRCSVGELGSCGHG